MFSICQHEGRWHSGSAWRVTRRERNSWYNCLRCKSVVHSHNISHLFKLGQWRLWPQYSNAECIAIKEKMPWVTWYAPLLVTWVGIMINGRFSAFTLGLLFWSTKLAHENKSFSSPPLNVWFRVSVQQITLYRSRTAFWLLIKESIKAHWLMTLCGLKKMIYADVFWATKVQPPFSVYTPFSFRK